MLPPTVPLWWSRRLTVTVRVKKAVIYNRKKKEGGFRPFRGGRGPGFRSAAIPKRRKVIVARKKYSGALVVGVIISRTRAQRNATRRDEAGRGHLLRRGPRLTVLLDVSGTAAATDAQSLVVIPAHAHGKGFALQCVEREKDQLLRLMLLLRTTRIKQAE